MIEFDKYAKISRKYCVCYLGPNEDFAKRLVQACERIQQRWPEVVLVTGLRDDFLRHATGECVAGSELKARHLDFAHIHEVAYDGRNDPIEQFLRESGIVG